MTLNKVFILYCIYFAAVISGVISRVSVPYVTIGLLIWSWWVPLEEAVLFFIRSIPLFIAIPLTAAYDNLNMWRPLALLLFALLVFQKETRIYLKGEWIIFKQGPVGWIKAHPVFRRCMILLVLAALSLITATYPIEGIKRVIYFVNLSMVPVVLYSLIRSGKISNERIISNLAIPTVIVIAVGFGQLFSTYLIDVYQFMRLWGEEIQLRQFGREWSYIAVNVGNTWLAYYGDQLSLRVFSLFPDSHSFPVFVLLGIPALFAWGLKPIWRIAESASVWVMARTRAKLSILWVPAGFLIAILSGTRGIWAASVGVANVAGILVWYFYHRQIALNRQRMFHYLSLYLLVFFMLFAVAWPLFTSPQFLLGKGDLNLFGHRLRSVVDFGETSNALRIAIWKASIHSIAKHPWLGVGIGNFPVVLDQNIILARAGSTAHNLYLHVTAEMGILAGLEVIVLLASAWWATVRWFMTGPSTTTVYAGFLILSLIWVFAYVMTDPIVFDERVFLMLATTLAIVWANTPTEVKKHND